MKIQDKRFVDRWKATARRMCRLWCVFVLALGCAWASPETAMGQKKQISTAKENIKKGSNLENAEQTMCTLLKDSANRNNTKIWSVLFDALKKQYEQGNEKIYLKQNYDTANLFKIASRMFQQMEAFDSIDAKPDEKGHVKLTMRKVNADFLNRLRPNLFSGGHFFIRKKKYEDAYRLFDQYIDAARQPMFATYHYNEKDANIPEASYWAVYCAYKMEDSQKTLHHTYQALKDTAHYEMMLQYLAETYKRDADTSRYMKTLMEGFRRYPLSLFFYSHLIDSYSLTGQWSKALALTDSALKVDSTSQLFWQTKGTILLNMGDFAHCFDISQRLINENDSLPEAWLNAGLAKFNLGVGLDKTAQPSKLRNTTLQYYKDALPYLVKYRALRPERKDKWALPLYTIYLNLNMGKEFDEIDKLMEK